MGRCRRAILWAAGGGLASAGAVFVLLDHDPTLADAFRDGRISWPWGLAGMGVLAVILLAAIPAALPFERLRKAASLSLLGIVLSAAALLAVCPSFLRAGWRVPVLRPALGWLLMGDAELGDDWIWKVSYEERGLVARTHRGHESVWSRDEGTFLEHRETSPPPTSALPARPLPLDALRGGTPFRVFQTPGRFAETQRSGPLKSKWTRGPIAGRPPDPGVVSIPRQGRNIWCTVNGRKVLSLPDVEALAFSSDGRLMFVAAPFELPAPMPGVPREAIFRFQAQRTLGILHDLEERRVLWRLLLPLHSSAEFSPDGAYLSAGRLMIDVRAGRVLGDAGGHVKAWLEQESCVAVASPGTRILTLPGLEELGRHDTLNTRRFVLRPDGREVATWEPGQRDLQVLTFPALTHVRSHRVLMPTRRCEFAGAAGTATAVFFGLIGLALPGAAGPRPDRSSSSAARRFLFSYVFLIPAATAAAAFLPIDLGDGSAFVSYLATGGLVLPMAWSAAGPVLARLGMSLLALALPGLAVVASLKRAATPCYPFGFSELVDDRWIRARDRILEIDTGREVGRLGFDFPGWLERDGSVLRGWTWQSMLEWSTEDWTLRRAERRGAWWFEDPGRRPDRDWMPVEVPWRLALDRHQSVRHLANGRAVYLREEKGTTWLMMSDIGRRRFLEIPLHAALGAILVVLLTRGRGCPGASPGAASPSST